MNTQNIFTKKMLMNLLLGLLLTSSLAQAQKRTNDDISSDDGITNTGQEHRADAEGAPVGAAGTSTTPIATNRGAAATDEEPSKKRNRIQETQGGAASSGSAEDDSLYDRDVTLTCRHFPSRVFVPQAGDLVVALRNGQELVIPQLNVDPLCDEWLRLINQKDNQPRKPAIEDLLTQIFNALSEEQSPITRILAYHYAQRFLSEQTKAIRFIFAGIADFLGSDFLSIMAWYSLNHQEQELIGSQKTPNASKESPQKRFPFYAWELALQENRLTHITLQQREAHLLHSTEGRIGYILLGLQLLATTGNDLGLLSIEHKQILYSFASDELRVQANYQQMSINILGLFIMIIDMDNLNDIPENNIEAFLDIIQALPNLNRFTFHLVEIHERRLAMIFNRLGQTRNLETFSLRFNNLGQLTRESLETILDSLARMQSLRSLRIEDNNNLQGLNEGVLQIIFDRLTRMQNLTSLGFSLDNLRRLPAQNLDIIFDRLARMQNLTTFHLMQKTGIFIQLNLNQAPIQGVLNHLARMQNLTELTVTNILLERLDQRELRAVFNTLSRMNNLTSISFTATRLDELGIRSLRAAFSRLARMQNLTKLNFQGNNLHQLTAEELKIVFDNLAMLQNLINLTINFNQLGELDEERLQIVFNGLANMQNLEEINLELNNFSTEVILRLRERLPNTRIIF